MAIARTGRPNAALVSLEAAAEATRTGFACMFSTSDEYESALIAERRANGHYDRTHNRWPVAMFIGFAVVIAGCALFLN